jgi:hypothetical protein
MYIPESSFFEVMCATEKLKRCKSLGVDQILMELISADPCSEVHKLMNSIWDKEELVALVGIYYCSCL